MMSRTPEGEDEDPEADITIAIPELILTDALNNGGNETELQLEWCQEQWDRIKDGFRFHEAADGEDE